MSLLSCCLPSGRSSSAWSSLDKYGRFSGSRPLTCFCTPTIHPLPSRRFRWFLRRQPPGAGDPDEPGSPRLSRSNSRASMSSIISGFSISQMSVDSMGSRRQSRDTRGLGEGYTRVKTSPFAAPDGPPIFPLGGYSRQQQRRVPPPVPAAPSTASSNADPERPSRDTWRSLSPARPVAPDRDRWSMSPGMRYRRIGGSTEINSGRSVVVGSRLGVNALSMPKVLGSAGVTMPFPSRSAGPPATHDVNNRDPERERQVVGEPPGALRYRFGQGPVMVFRGTNSGEHRVPARSPSAPPYTTNSDVDRDGLGQHAAQPSMVPRTKPDDARDDTSAHATTASMGAEPGKANVMVPSAGSVGGVESSRQGRGVGGVSPPSTIEAVGGSGSAGPVAPPTYASNEPSGDANGGHERRPLVSGGVEPSSQSWETGSQEKVPDRAISGGSDYTAALSSIVGAMSEVDRDESRTPHGRLDESTLMDVSLEGEALVPSMGNDVPAAPPPPRGPEAQPPPDAPDASTDFGIPARPSPFVNTSSPLTALAEGDRPGLFEGDQDADGAGSGAGVVEGGAADVFAAAAPAGTADALFDGSDPSGLGMASGAVAGDSRGGGGGGGGMKSEAGNPFAMGPPAEAPAPQPTTSLPNPWGSSPLTKPLPAPKAWPTKGGVGFDRPTSPRGSAKEAPPPHGFSLGRPAVSGAVPNAFLDPRDDGVPGAAATPPSLATDSSGQRDASNAPTAWANGKGDGRSRYANPGTAGARESPSMGLLRRSVSPFGSSSSMGSAASVRPPMDGVARGPGGGGAGGRGAGRVPATPPGTRAGGKRDAKVKPPGVIARFGFGGRLVCMHPRRKMRLASAGRGHQSHDEPEGSQLRKGPVKVWRERGCWRAPMPEGRCVGCCLVSTVAEPESVR